MASLHSETYATGPLAHVITAVFMPSSEVSERTETSHRIGAQKLLTHLMEGDLTSDANDGAFGEFLGEFTRRMIANAERQGIDLALQGDEAQIAPSA